MTSGDISPELRSKLEAVTGKRPRTVIQHILEHGHVTTEELQQQYGYDHPPRAARDVREQGIPLETFRVPASNGRLIGAYRFGDLSQIQSGRLGGRMVAPKEFKKQLVALFGGRCAVCHAAYEERYLQVDHRVPYEMLSEADTSEWDTDEFMPLCGTDNRAKSWSCEHCPNMTDLRDPTKCETCYWASPEDYDHIALVDQRRLGIVWAGDEAAQYERLQGAAQDEGLTPGELIKKLLDQNLGR